MRKKKTCNNSAKLVNIKDNYIKKQSLATELCDWRVIYFAADLLEEGKHLSADVKSQCMCAATVCVC